MNAGTLRGTATLDDLETSFQGGKNIYIQGCAGSGKTTLLKTKVVEMLKQQYGQDCLDSGAVQVCGTTGVSALNIGGRTVHSVVGIGHGNGLGSDLWDKRTFEQQKEITEMLAPLTVLMCDEWPLMSGRMFDVLVDFLECAGKPRTSLQFLFSGDGCQLPPVAEKKDTGKRHACSWWWEAACMAPAAAAAQARVDPLEFDYYLMPDFSHRHAGHADYFRLLQELAVRRPAERYGSGRIKVAAAKLSEEFMGLLQRRHAACPADGAVALCGTVETAAAINAEALNQLSQGQGVRAYCAVQGTKVAGHGGLAHEGQVCAVIDGGDAAADHNDSGLGPKRLSLCVRAAVVTIRCVHPRVPTGSRGVVHGFKVDRVGAEMQWTRDARWMELPADVRRRAPALVNPLCEWPEVGFNIDGDEIKVLIRPHMFMLETITGVVLGHRLMVPLLLGYAMTIHRSQSLTLPKVAVFASELWEPGHLYTAMSRVRSPEDLQIITTASGRAVWQSMRGAAASAAVLDWFKVTQWKRLVLESS